VAFDDGIRRIGDDPFAVPPEDRDQARRFRGSMAAPVTVWTSSGGDGPAGLTVSSTIVVEGSRPSLLGLIGSLTDLWEAISTSRRFVVHVLSAPQARLADQFAGRYPVTPFESVDVAASDWGPVLVDVPNRAFCELESSPLAGYFLLVSGLIAGTQLIEIDAPLVNYRGQYVTTAPRRS